jgi:hypothetical protein
VTQRVRGYHLPQIEGKFATGLRHCGDVDLELPQLRPEELGAALAAVKESASWLRAQSTEGLLSTFDGVVQQWLATDSSWRRVAESVLPPLTGFSPQMIRYGLPLLFRALSGDAIATLLDAELGDRRLLDEVCDGRRALGPPLIAHILPGNIPGLAAAPMLLSLAVKSTALVKTAAGDPAFAALFAASIAEADPELGRCLAVTHWRGGNDAVEAVALTAADLVVASGTDAAMAALAARGARRFIGHGHKISCALVGAERLADAEAATELARRLAYDVSLWDQQGCLSPQLCYVEAGGRVAPAAFGQLLGGALQKLTVQLPPRQLTLAEKAQVLRFRQEAEWGGASLIVSQESSDWSVSVEPDERFLPTCLHRCIRLKAVPHLAALGPVLAPHRGRLEAAGVAVGRRRLAAITEMLAACGVHRICRIGSMQLPPLSWQPGGRPRVADWVEWTTVEPESVWA